MSDHRTMLTEEGWVCRCGVVISTDIDWDINEAYEAHLRAVRKAEHEHL